MKIRKKPVIVEAVQYPCEHPALRRCGCDPNWPNTDGPSPPQGCSACGKEYIETLEGRMIVSPGDWIITGVQGEHYPCKPDIFEATYEPVSEPDEHEPMPAADVLADLEPAEREALGVWTIYRSKNGWKAANGQHTVFVSGPGMSQDEVLNVMVQTLRLGEIIGQNDTPTFEFTEQPA